MRIHTSRESNELQHLTRLARIADQEHHIALTDHTEVTVLCFTRVEEVGWCTRGAKGRSDVVGDLSRLPHSRGDESTSTLMYTIEDEADRRFVIVVLGNGAECFYLRTEDLRDGILLGHIVRGKTFLSNKGTSFC